MPRAKQVKMTAMTLRFTDPYIIRVIDHAAFLSNQTRTGFLLAAAQEKAEEIIMNKSNIRSEVETMLISSEAYEKVINRLEHPQKPTKRMVKAMKDYKNWSKKNGFTETE
jgi:uncharacterized protein (DUF1778 family)